MENKVGGKERVDAAATAATAATTGPGAREVMTLPEVAAHLRLAEKTVLRMVHKGQIPCAKVASQWRFLRSMIDDWLIAKMQVVPQNDLARLIESSPEVVPLSRLLKTEQVVLDVRPGPKEAVLRQLIQPLLRSRFIDQEKPFLDKLMEREAIVSTAVGRGVAIPHLRNPRDNPGGGPVLIVGICRPGTDFEAPDGRATQLFFFLCTDSEVVHLRVLAKVNRIARRTEIKSRLIGAGSPAEVLQVLVQADQEGA